MKKPSAPFEKKLTEGVQSLSGCGDEETIPYLGERSVQNWRNDDSQW